MVAAERKNSLESISGANQESGPADSLFVSLVNLRQRGVARKQSKHEIINRDVDLILPWPPSVNRIWRYAGGRCYLDKKTAEYKNIVKSIVLNKNLDCRLSGRISVKIRAFPPDKRKRDIDNTLKALIDSVVFSGVLKDDEQIDVLSITREQIEKGGRIEIKISEIN